MMMVFLWIGVVCLIVTGIVMGVWTDGQTQRANFHSETEEHRLFKQRVSKISGIIGLVSLGISGILYLL